jgi:hypothetical protein
VEEQRRETGVVVVVGALDDRVIETGAVEVGPFQVGALEIDAG